MKYYCFRCGYLADRKYNLKRHLDRKTSCLPMYLAISRDEILNNYEEHMDAFFELYKNINNLRGHKIQFQTYQSFLKNSKKDTDIDSEKNQIVLRNEIFENDEKEINEDINESMPITINQSITINGDVDQSNSNCTNFDFSMNMYNKNNIDHISESDLKYIIENMNECLERMIKIIHVNEVANRNVYVDHPDFQKCLVVGKNNKLEIIDSMEMAGCLINNYTNNIQQQVSSYQLDKTFDKVGYLCDIYNSNLDKLQNIAMNKTQQRNLIKNKKKVINSLYNHKNIIGDTMKKKYPNDFDIEVSKLC